METKTCKICERELPIASFRASRWGNPTSICKECIAAKYRETRQENRGGGDLRPFSDPDFDGKEPGEVVRMMGRAKQWLESRGFTIRLEGEFTKVEVKKLKFL